MTTMHFWWTPPDPTVLKEEQWANYQRLFAAHFVCGDCHAGVETLVTQEMMTDEFPLAALFAEHLNAFLDSEGHPPCPHLADMPKRPVFYDDLLDDLLVGAVP